MTTKRAPQCTTYAQLHEHMAHVYRMREGASVTVSSCVRKNGGPPTRWSDHPVFDGKPEEFEFALGIIERRPVFRYDVLYDQNGNKWIAIGVFFGIADGQLRLVRNASDQDAGAILPLESLSWNPPRRTIKIGEVEVPAPEEVRYHSAFGNIIELEFSTHDDAFIAKAALEGKKP